MIDSPIPKQATPEILDFDEADARLDGALSDSFQQSCYESVALFDGDLTIDGSFMDAMESLEVADATIIAVAGNLTVNGAIDLYDYMPGLYVGGFTLAETLECGDCEVYLDGTITYAVYFCGNEGMGLVDVDAPWVINHGRLLNCWPEKALIVDTRDSHDRGTDAKVDFDESNIAAAFVAEVVDDEEDTIRFDKFLERLRAGQPVLRDGARTLAEATTDHVVAVTATGAATLDLTERNLDALPAGITSMTALRRLILDGNAIGQLPNEIGEMTNLEELSVRNCELTELPESIGQLGQLRVLRVSGNIAWACGPVQLPKSIGELANLEELELSALSIENEDKIWAAPFALPEALGRLTSLRRLVANGTGVVIPPSMRGLASLREVQIRGASRHRLPEFPDGLTSFPNLTVLDLAHHLFFEVPASLLDLVHLEELNLDFSLGPMEGPIPDLSQLPKLRVLRLAGSTSVGPPPSHDLLRPLFSMSLAAIEDLGIDRWASGRGPLAADMLTRIGAWRTLRRLDLSWNGLTDLPDELLDLPHLEWLDLCGNNFDQTTRQRITAALPTAQIVFDYS